MKPARTTHLARVATDAEKEYSLQRAIVGALRGEADQTRDSVAQSQRRKGGRL